MRIAHYSYNTTASLRLKITIKHKNVQSVSSVTQSMKKYSVIDSEARKSIHRRECPLPNHSHSTQEVAQEQVMQSCSYRRKPRHTLKIVKQEVIVNAGNSEVRAAWKIMVLWFIDFTQAK